MEDDYYYTDEETDFRPWETSEMDDPSNGHDDEDNYDCEDDSWHDADTYTSIGWGTDEDYGHYGYDEDGGAW